MSKTSIFRNIVLFTVLSLIVFGFGQFNLPAVTADSFFPIEDFSTKIAQAQYQQLVLKANQQGQLRLIVRLNAAFNPEMMALDGPEAHTQQRGIEITQAQIRQALSSTNARVLHDFKYIPFNVITVDANALNILLSLPFVLGVEEDRIESVSLSDSIPLINADDAWTNGYTGAGQVIAILDTGVDKFHPFLANKVISESCYSSNYVDTNPESPNYSSTSICPGGVEQSTAAGSALPYAGTCASGECDHGTHVAGIAVGKGVSFSGVAKDAEIIAIQVFSRFDSYCGYPCSLSWSSDQLRGLERAYALRDTYNLVAVNMSIGGGHFTSFCDSDSRKAQIDLLRSVGIATVISSGNNGYSDGISAPGCISSAISVGATTKSDVVASYSNSDTMLKLLAPGSSIYSSIPNMGYAWYNGTSMAAPHVAGAWAVIKSKNSSATVDEVLAALQTTGIPILDSRNGITKPRIDVMAALDTFASPPSPPSGLSATAASTEDYLDLSWTDNSDNEQGFRIERRIPSGSWSQVDIVVSNQETYRDNTTACETTYEYRVKAYNTGGDSSPSNTASDTTTICALSGLGVTTTQQRITLDWIDNSAIEHGYRVERSPDGSTNWTQLGSDLAENTITFYEYPLPCNSATYYYRVTVFDAAVSRTSSVVSGATQSCTSPVQPENPSARPLSISSIEVTWDDVGDYETGYRIEHSADGNAPWIEVGIVGQDQLFFVDIYLEINEDYYYRIFATNSEGSSPPSSIVSATTYPVSFLLPLIMH